MKAMVFQRIDGKPSQVGVHCPGCGHIHPFDIRGVTKRKDASWEWNGSLENPTFSPSMLVWQSKPEKRCHSFVRDGKIEFLNDCWHDLKGQTVELPDID